MSTSKPALPRGIRNKNPGNLRHAVTSHCKSSLLDKFAVFETSGDGLANLALLCWQFYFQHSLRTPFAFVSRYAPASENDVTLYVGIVCKYLRIDPSKAKSADMKLQNDWALIDLMRAIVHVENGPPPLGHSLSGEWCGPYDLAASVARAQSWLNP